MNGRNYSHTKIAEPATERSTSVYTFIPEVIRKQALRSSDAAVFMHLIFSRSLSHRSSCTGHTPGSLYILSQKQSGSKPYGALTLQSSCISFFSRSLSHRSSCTGHTPGSLRTLSFIHNRVSFCLAPFDKTEGIIVSSDRYSLYVFLSFFLLPRLTIASASIPMSDSVKKCWLSLDYEKSHRKYKC